MLGESLRLRQSGKQDGKRNTSEGRSCESDPPAVEVCSKPPRGRLPRPCPRPRRPSGRRAPSAESPYRLCRRYRLGRPVSPPRRAHRRTLVRRSTQSGSGPTLREPPQRRPRRGTGASRARARAGPRPSPYGLHQAIEQVVEAGRRRNFGKRHLEGVGDGHEHRGDHEAVEAAKEGGELQEPRPSGGFSRRTHYRAPCFTYPTASTYVPAERNASRAGSHPVLEPGHTSASYPHRGKEAPMI